jgi:Domain of unknown function (DUF6379)
MFEKYMIVAEKAQNTLEGNKTTGFQFGAKIPYYRGLGLSMVEDIQVKIDGKPVKPEALRFTVHGNTYTLAEMENEPEDRWEMGEVAIISVHKKGGLPKGEHKIDLLVNLRISYLPFPAIRLATKQISIQ